jgi:conjugative relaxase-like TrwC/TraI family protein
VLSIAKLSAGQEDYFLEVEDERVDALVDAGSGAAEYYADAREAPGRWAGAGAARLGLAGAVRPDELRRLFAGAHPVADAEQRPTVGARVAAFDLTFSASKSVSVLFGLGDDSVQSAVRRGHDRAAAEALRYLERNAAAVRRGRGGAVVLPASGLVAAVFRHRTSRAGDPQLHSHVVVANIGYGADGRWTALDGRRLYQHATAACRIYQAVLRGELTRTLGVEWAPVRDGIA